MSERSVRIGPGAASIMMILLTLILTTLGALSFIGARGDLSLSERARDMTEEYYMAVSKAQTIIGDIDLTILECKNSAKTDTEFDKMLFDKLDDDVYYDDYIASFSIDAGADRSLSVTLLINPLSDESARYTVSEFALVDDIVWEDEDLNFMP